MEFLVIRFLRWWVIVLVGMLWLFFVSFYFIIDFIDDIEDICVMF